MSCFALDSANGCQKQQEYRNKYEQEVAINRGLSEEARLLRGNNEEIRILYDEAREKYRNLHFLFEQKINECEALTIKLHDLDLIVDRNKELYDQFNRALRENDMLSSKLRSDETMATEEALSLRSALNERERRIAEMSRHLEEANIALESENRRLRETALELDELRRKYARDREDSETMIKRLMTDLDESQRRGIREIVKEVPKVQIIREPARIEYVKPDPVQNVVFKEDPELEAKLRRLERENRDLKAELDKFRNICDDKEDEIERLRVLQCSLAILIWEAEKHGGKAPGNHSRGS